MELSEEENTPYRIYNVSKQIYDSFITEIINYEPGSNKDIILTVITQNNWDINDILCIHNDECLFVCRRNAYFTFNNFCMPEIMPDGSILMRHDGESTSFSIW